MHAHAAHIFALIYTHTHTPVSCLRGEKNQDTAITTKRITIEDFILCGLLVENVCKFELEQFFVVIYQVLVELIVTQI
jgi:hypothetical protein